MEIKIPFLEVKNIYKKFNQIQALDDVSLQAHLGEILAIVGDNGAGKSTLAKILAGSVRPDQGELVVDGQSYSFLSPKTAIQSGISTVYQDLALADSRDVAANIFLGREITWGPFLNHRRMDQQSRQLILDLHIDIPNVKAPVAVLSGGQRQGVAVARAIHQGGKLFIFDEPTAAMGLNETAKVQSIIKKLARDGYGIIIISHNMQQVFELSDRICIMRHGQVINTLQTKDTTTEGAVALITGVA